MTTNKIEILTKTATLVFGCSDKALDYDAWQNVFAELAAHLQAAANEDLYGDDWSPADEGCAITADAERIQKIKGAIAAFAGPVYVLVEGGIEV